MVKEFAEYFSLTIWDWFTAIVAVISLIVAVFAFVIAIKTYRVSKKTLASQQQTEKNTTPVINLKIQELILNKMIENLYFDRMELMAIWTLLKSKNYTHYLVDAIWDGYIIDINSVHYELFYDESIDFQHIEDLRKRIKDYNMVLLSLKESIRIQANQDTIEALFSTLFRIINLLPWNFLSIQNDVFNKEESHLIPLHEMYQGISFCLDAYKDVNKKPIYFEEDDVYLILMGKIPFPRIQILLSTDDEVEKNIKRLSHYLIECKS